MSVALPRKLISVLGTVACAAVLAVLPAEPTYAAVEPLQDYVPVTSIKLSEDIDENWSFTTNTPYWSVLGVRPPSGWDVIADAMGADGTGYVRSMPNGITGVNFVVIDSNAGRRPFGPYYGRAITYTPPPNWPGGAAPYTIMHAQGADIIWPGTTSVTWGRGRFIAVRDILLSAGQQVTVTINPSDIGYLFASDMADSGTWIQPRDSAAARTTAGRLRYTAPRSGWYGLVLVNRRGVSTSTVRVSVA